MGSHAARAIPVSALDEGERQRTAWPVERVVLSHQELAVGGLGQVVLSKGLVAAVAATLGGTVAPRAAFQPSVSQTRLRLDLGNALVFRGELSLGYAFATRPRIHVVAAYEFGTFAYGRSSTVPIGDFGVTEPASRTFDHELRAGVAIGF